MSATSKVPRHRDCLNEEVQHSAFLRNRACSGLGVRDGCPASLMQATDGHRSLSSRFPHCRVRHVRIDTTMTGASGTFPAPGAPRKFNERLPPHQGTYQPTDLGRGKETRRLDYLSKCPRYRGQQPLRQKSELKRPQSSPRPVSHSFIPTLDLRRTNKRFRVVVLFWTGRGWVRLGCIEFKYLSIGEAG